MKSRCRAFLKIIPLFIVALAVFGCNPQLAPYNRAAFYDDYYEPPEQPEQPPDTYPPQDPCCCPSPQPDPVIIVLPDVPRPMPIAGKPHRESGYIRHPIASEKDNRSGGAVRDRSSHPQQNVSTIAPMQSQPTSKPARESSGKGEGGSRPSGTTRR